MILSGKIEGLIPMGAPRLTRTGKYGATAQKYHGYCNILRMRAGTFKSEGRPFLVQLGFSFEMPKSWSNKKKAAKASTPHTSKPDLDNLCKGIIDALVKDDPVNPDGTKAKQYGDQTMHKLEGSKHWAGIGKGPAIYYHFEHIGD